MVCIILQMPSNGKSQFLFLWAIRSIYDALTQNVSAQEATCRCEGTKAHLVRQTLRKRKTPCPQQSLVPINITAAESHAYKFHTAFVLLVMVLFWEIQLTLSPLAREGIFPKAISRKFTPYKLFREVLDKPQKKAWADEWGGLLLCQRQFVSTTSNKGLLSNKAFVPNMS